MRPVPEFKSSRTEVMSLPAHRTISSLGKRRNRPEIISGKQVAKVPTKKREYSGHGQSERHRCLLQGRRPFQPDQARRKKQKRTNRPRVRQRPSPSQCPRPNHPHRFSPRADTIQTTSRLAPSVCLQLLLVSLSARLASNYSHNPPFKAIDVDCTV